MYKLFQLLIFLVLFSIEMTAQVEKEWTLLLYVTGSDIVEDAITDIDEMKAAGNTDNINIVGLLGGSQREGWETPLTFSFENGEDVPQSFVPSADNMATSSNLTEYLNWAIPNFPAEKYMLVFYNHGMDIRGFGWDSNVNQALAVGDIQNGIGNSDFIQDGNHFEIIGFDACLMACFEVQSALRDYGKYYIASEETEPYHAWNWTPVITGMNNQPGLSGQVLGQIIVDTYFQQSIAEGTKHVTLSVSELDKITALETALNDVFIEIDEEEEIEHFIQARAMSEEYCQNISKPEDSEDMVDIGDLLQHFKDLEPSLSSLIDEALSKLDDAIFYERSDESRPKANGMSMYVPLNGFIDDDELLFLLNNTYDPIDFSGDIKDFIIERYTPYLMADQDPATGSIDDGFGFTSGGGTLLGEKYSAIKVDGDNDDLHQIQVVLLEEIEGIPDEFLLLGSTYPDTSRVNMDGTITYGYEWDKEWLSLNGHPAYIADIQYFEVEDNNGNVDYAFTRIYIPAVLNAGTAEEKQIQMSFTFDEDFNHELEEILRETYGDNILIPSKERINLQPGDQVQLMYEVFDATTNEAFFVVDEDNTIEIANGNEDLLLDHSMLEPGKYHLGFVLMDHAHNDTIIYDPMIREVMAVSNAQIEESAIQVTLSPNPSFDHISITFVEAVEASIKLFDNQGRIILNQETDYAKSAELSIGDLPAGTYLLQLIVNGQKVMKQIVKP